MTDHDALTLMALRRSERPRLGSRRISDVVVAMTGDEIFGAGWTQTRRGKRYSYAPLVSMSLGRLARLGLVVKRTDPLEERSTFHVWGLNEEGRALADGLLGETSP